MSNSQLVITIEREVFVPGPEEGSTALVPVTREETAFVDIESWGKQGEVISKYCTKGRPLFVEGRLKLDQWEDKTSGQKRSKLKVVLENFQFIGGRGDGAAPAGPGGAAGPGAADEGEVSAPPARAAKAPPKEAVDEDVPF